MALAARPLPWQSSTQPWWLFSPRADLAVFGGSALISLLALALGARWGLLQKGTPDWTWIAAVLFIDVAHVWSTVFRTYLDAAEVRRHRWRYALVPVLSLAVGMAVYTRGALVFWRVLAYLAVFHFIRQQYGWAMLYRARCGERDALGRWLDGAAVYAATLYPLLYWHAHLPRRSVWFMQGDFVRLPALASDLLPAAFAIYCIALGAYAIRSAMAWAHGRPNPGKDVLLATTAVCWYVGIVSFNSDYAFTVTNVIIHGVPYMALLYGYGRARWRQGAGGGLRLFGGGPIPYLAILWGIAFLEELVWDRGVWHERAWLFGSAWPLERLHVLLVPLLALPQIVHYVLDGLVWRRGASPDFNLLDQG